MNKKGQPASKTEPQTLVAVPAESEYCHIRAFDFVERSPPWELPNLAENCMGHASTAQGMSGPSLT